MKWLKALTAMILSLAVSFVCIGYAQVVNTLTVTGSINVPPPQTLFITEVEYLNKGSGISTVKSTDFNYPTTVNTEVLLKSSSRSSRTVTYAITVWNNTSYKYVYKGISGTTTNLNVVTKVNQNDRNQTFKPNEATVERNSTVTFYATYTFDSSDTLDNQTIASTLEYQFGIHVDSMGDMAMDRVLIKFGEILNTPFTYQYLITHIDDKYVDQGWQANYIGNVHGASNDDTKTIEYLFDEDLSLTIDGVTKNITLLIKRDNFDNNQNTGDSYVATNGNNRVENKGCEMALYMTANNLDKKIDAGEFSETGTQAEVYIAVFTCQPDANGNPVGDWYQIGDVYKGFAPIVTYDGGNGTGSFITDEWNSLKTTYKVTSNYSYTINRGDARANGIQDIQEILVQTDVTAVSEFNRLLNLARAQISYINQNADYFNEDVFNAPIATLHTIYEKAAAMTVNNNTPRAHLIKILKELENATYPFTSYVS